MNICDRCYKKGKTIAVDPKFDYVFGPVNNPTFRGNLCGPCAQEIEKFIDGTWVLDWKQKKGEK